MAELLAAIPELYEQYIEPCLPGMLLGLMLLIGAFAFIVYSWRAALPRRQTLEWISLQTHTPLSFSLPCFPMERRDTLPLLLLTLVYAFTAFFQLGITTNPQSAADFSDGEPMVITLEDDVYLTKLMYYSGLGTGSYNVEISADGETWLTLWARTGEDGKTTGYYWADAAGYTASYAMSQRYNNLFKWLEIEPENPQYAQYLRITGRTDRDGPLELSELALYDENRARVAPAFSAEAQSFYPLALNLFDEQDVVPDHPSWRNSTYFDEIYHARTALEHIRGLYPYEVSHPPLGKLIIGLGIHMFGMTPFGWRFMGTLFGVLMLPILYVFLKNLFGKTVVAACGTALFAFDFMHLTQTRIATIDTYAVFFILLMYFFMYRYLTLPAGTPFARGALPLFLSGLFWGIGAASKWTVIYAGAGLAVVYFIGMAFHLRDWPREGAPSRTGWVVRTLLFSVLCFVVIPVGIYMASYLPYAQAKGELSLPALWEIVKNNQIFMFTYHEGVTATHSYSSRWYQWVVDARPILYYLDNSAVDFGGGKAAFACFSNPIVCWTGLLAVLSLFARGCIGFFRRVAHRPRVLLPLGGRALFILIGYLSQLVPWMFIGRTTFAYHYFPSTLFLVLAIALLMNELIERRPKHWKGALYALTGSAVALYTLFYPVLIGLTVPVSYTSYLLKWLPSWPF